MRTKLSYREWEGVRTKLSYREWEALDELLEKHGFGGYYDLLETLKMIAANLGIGNTGADMGDPAQRWTLPDLVNLLVAWSSKLSHTDGFQEIAELAARAV